MWKGPRVAPAAAAALGAVLLAGAAAGAPEHPALRVDDPKGLFERVNSVRIAQGSLPLRQSPALQRAALMHSREMLEHGIFAHESADGASFSLRVVRFYPASGFTSWRVAENILSSNKVLPPGSAVAVWLKSAPHRQVLLDPALRDVGIAAVFTQAAPGVFHGRPTWVVTMDAGARHRY